MSITEAQILAEIESAMAEADTGPDDAITTAELAELLGVHQDTAKIRLKVLAKAGRLEMVRVKRQSVLSSYAQTVTAFRILPAA